jgi:hypothetical protein
LPRWNNPRPRLARWSISPCTVTKPGELC